MPPKKKAKLDNVTIEALPEALLAKVFSYLPLKERYRASAVCKRWLSVSRIPWTDVSYLNASAIPNDKIKTILDLCPKLKQFVACGRDIKLEENKNLLGTHLRSLRLYEVEVSFPGDRDRDADNATFERLVAAFFQRMPELEELVWQYVLHRGRDVEIPASIMVASLRRLKIVNDIHHGAGPADMMTCLRQMVNLECLHLEGIIKPGPAPVMDMSRSQALENIWDGLALLTKLKELCVAQVILRHIYGGPIPLKQLADFACEKLPQLEVLIYADDASIEPEGISQLITSHPSLRILLIAGEDVDLSERQTTPFILPPRTLRPRCSTTTGGSPTVQVFVGGHILRKLRFTLPEANTTKFWLIDCVLPKFLAKPDVAEVFEGVWLAQMIRESAEVGSEFWVWGGRWEAETFYTQAPRAGLRSRTARIDNYWPEAILRR